MKIRVSSSGGVVQYQVLRRTCCGWVVLKAFGTRKEAKRFIESQRG